LVYRCIGSWLIRLEVNGKHGQRQAYYCENLVKYNFAQRVVGLRWVSDLIWD